MDIKNLKEVMKDRDLDEESIFFASFIAGLNEFGILNQMVMKEAGKRSGMYMANCLKSCYPEKSVKNPVELINFLNERLKITTDFIVEDGKDELIVKIRTDKCRYCPKGVGGAELKCTICPFPGIIESFVNAICENKIKAIPISGKFLNKKEGFCVISFKKEK